MKIASWLIAIAWAALMASARPPALMTLAGLAVVALMLRRTSPRTAPAAVAALAVLAILRPASPQLGYGRFFADETYHHQALRALNQVAAMGADVSEVLETTSQVHAGNPQGWYTAWTALGERNLARARETKDPQSRAHALLRAHTYFLRAEFFLPANDPKRPASFDRNRKAFYQGLDTLGVAYEKIAAPFEGHTLNAVYYPAPTPARAPLLVFCGGSDTTVEELYFFLVPAAHARGYSVLTYEGPGQGAVLREQHVTMTPEWEKPTAAVLDAYLASHAKPASTVLIGLSLGGYLASRAAAFDDRIHGLVTYDVFYDGADVARHLLPPPARLLRALGLGSMLAWLAPIVTRFDPGAAWSLGVGGWILGKTTPLEVTDELSRYTLEGVADRIRQDVLLLAGESDHLVPAAQLERFQQALVHARSITTHVYDRASGGASHSQLGAPTLWQAHLFDWLDAKFGTAR